MTDEPSDTPPPMDNDGNDGGEEAPPPVAPTEGSSVTSAPPVGAVAIGQGKLSEQDDKLFGMLAHILGAVTVFVGPLIIWMMKKDESPFVNDQGKAALNFQLTVLIGMVASGILAVVPLIGWCAGPLLWGACVLASLIFGILGGVEANKGVAYRYPYSLYLIK